MVRESLWDDYSRERAFRLADYEAGICGCGCGQPLQIARDDKLTFKIDKIRCHARRAIEQVRRKEAREAETANRSEGWDDGLHYVVVDSMPTPEKPKRQRRTPAKRG